MANPTTYFGWVMPNSADLVTDLPADFNVFGQGVDTSMQYLLGGTTGQILSKTSGTNMAFTWINNDQGDITAVTAGTGITGGGTSGAVTITNDMATTITTNGDLIYGTGSGTYTRRAIGSTGNVLTVSGGIPTWAAPAGGGKVLQVVNASTTTQVTNATTTYADTNLTATITPTLNTSKVLVLVTQNGVGKNSSDASNGCNIKLLRTATTLGQITNAGWTGTALHNNIGGVGFSYLDSPATTSATTYKTTFANNNASNGAVVQWGSADTTVSYITLIEIGA